MFCVDLYMHMLTNYLCKCICHVQYELLYRYSYPPLHQQREIRNLGSIVLQHLSFYSPLLEAICNVNYSYSPPSYSL